MLVSVSFKDGEEIMIQGDEGDAIYFLESGSAVAIKDSQEGIAAVASPPRRCDVPTC